MTFDHFSKSVNKYFITFYSEPELYLLSTTHGLKTTLLSASVQTSSGIWSTGLKQQSFEMGGHCSLLVCLLTVENAENINVCSNC